MTETAPPIPQGWQPPDNQMARYAPLPEVREDPAVQAGNAAQQAYAARRGAIDATPGLSELARTEAIVQAYEDQAAAVQALAEDLRNRRAARRDFLQKMIPTGPGIPKDASPADAAVLHTAFRAHLDAARAVIGDKSKQMLAEALRFGDDTRMRAVLTVAEERSEAQMFDMWAAQTGNEALLAEMRALNNQLDGVTPDSGWERQAFHTPKRPNNEIAKLPGLRQRAEEEAQAAAKAQRLATPAYRQY